MSGQIEEVSWLIEGLREPSREIGGIAAVIKESADPTNSLALSAAIEAARWQARARLRGVADEVRNVAGDTGEPGQHEREQNVERVAQMVEESVESLRTAQQQH